MKFVTRVMVFAGWVSGFSRNPTQTLTPPAPLDRGEPVRRVLSSLP